MNAFLLFGKRETVNEFDLVKISKTFENTNSGYIIAVDIHFHFELHDKI